MSGVAPYPGAAQFVADGAHWTRWPALVPLMPLRRILLMFWLTAALLAGGVALTAALNPYGATPSRLIDPIFRKVKQERLATPYLLRTAEPETILLGSSRVQMGMRIEQVERDGVMNAAIKGATLSQIARIVDVALLNPRLKRIVWGVDFFAFGTRWDRDDPNFDARIAYRVPARIEDTLLSLDALGDGLDMAKRALRGRARLSATMRAGVPWSAQMICAQYASDRIGGLDAATPANIAMQLRDIAYLYDRFEFSPAHLELFRRTVAKILAHHVRLILFVPPMSAYELEFIRQSGHWSDLEKFKRALAAVAPFEDYAAFNGMAVKDAFYLQVIHFKVAPGEEILRTLLGMPVAACDADARLVAQSGVHIDAANVDAILAMEDRWRDDQTDRDSRYSRLVADAVRQAKIDQTTGSTGESADE